jgi:integrase
MPHRAPKKEKHQTRTGSGTLAHIRINGELHRRHFKRGTPPIRIREWLLATETKYRIHRARRTGKFQDDAQVYLSAVAAMPTFADRRRHIEEWIAVFGERERDSITADEIRAQLQRWRTEHRIVTHTRRQTTNAVKTSDVVLSASAVNKRRTALMHLFSVLDGKSAPNPVKDVPKFAEPQPAPRAIPYPLLQQMFAQMRPSKSKARLMAIAYTGIPHAQIKTLTDADLHLDTNTVSVAGRRKGRGTRARIVPLTPDGVAAMKAMRQEEAWGPFSNAMLRLALRRAMRPIDKALAKTITPYDLRHSFGTEVYRRSGDIRATQLLMDHSTEKLTHRYTLAAQDPRVQQAIASFSPPQEPPPPEAKGSKRSSKPKTSRRKQR